MVLAKQIPGWNPVVLTGVNRQHLGSGKLLRAYLAALLKRGSGGTLSNGVTASFCYGATHSVTLALPGNWSLGLERDFRSCLVGNRNHEVIVCSLKTGDTAERVSWLMGSFLLPPR